MTAMSLSRTRWLVLLVALPTLSACAGWSIHDASRAQLAAEGKQAYADAKVLEVADVEQKNLDLLLAQEIKVVRENSALQSDFAALAMANNSGPMAESYAEAIQALETLGYASRADLRAAVFAGLKLTRSRDTLASTAKALRSYNVAVPDCLARPDEPPSFPNGEAKSAYEQYLRTCDKIVGSTKLPRGGRVGTAASQWQSANVELFRQQQQKAAALKAARDAATAYREAVARNAAPTEAAAQANADLAAKEKALAEALGQLQALRLAGTFDNSITALVDVLTASAAGDTDTSHPDLAEAAVVLKQLPALRSAAAELQATRAAVPVSGLLMELQRQTLLATAAAKRQQLQEERVAILRAKLDAYQAEARRWMDFADAMCSYAVMTPDKRPSAADCDGLEVKQEQAQAPDGKTTCSLAGQVLPNCRLAASWKARLDASDEPVVRRELYKAAAGYLQAINAQSQPLELSFREIDVRHRETLLARRSAIEAWNGLVSVPLDQLDAYYRGGIKPAELADFIVKALGLTAIAVGVSK